MKKVIDPGREPVIHYYCDGCKRQIANPPDDLSYSLQVVGNFGYGSSHDGLMFNHSYCEYCGIKAIEAIELSLKIEIKAGDNILFECDEEDGVTDNSLPEHLDDGLGVEKDWDSL